MIDTEQGAREYILMQSGDRQFSLVEAYADALLRENQSQNLISRATETQLWVRHLADSGQLCADVSRETSGVWFDLGSGAGLPGLLVAIMRPKLSVVLVESRRKRWEWLDTTAKQLGLTNVRVVGKRLQMIEPEPAMYISARAFTGLRETLELACAFSTSATRWILPKGQSAGQEMAELPKWLREGFHVKQSLTNPDAGIVTGSMTRAVLARLARNRA